MFKVTIEDVEKGKKEEFELDQFYLMGEYTADGEPIMKCLAECSIQYIHLVLGRLIAEITSEWISMRKL